MLCFQSSNVKSASLSTQEDKATTISAALLCQRLENPLLPPKSCDPGALCGGEGKATGPQKSSDPRQASGGPPLSINQVYPTSSAGGGLRGKAPDFFQVHCVPFHLGCLYQQSHSCPHLWGVLIMGRFSGSDSLSLATKA